MVNLALRNPSKLRNYVSACLRKYDELVGNGLPCRSPVTPERSLSITLPAAHSGGGMSFSELVILARITKVLRPRTVFEIGTYNGLTTAVFMLNSDPEAHIVTLDLPTAATPSGEYIPSDSDLIARRDLGSVPRALGLIRYTQLLCDSMSFDPTPYIDSVDLGLVDGAHDLVHVQNDTLKMARMVSECGIVFWHDYGGKGEFCSLTCYLDALGKRAPIYRIPDTALAWAAGGDLRRVVGLTK